MFLATGVLTAVLVTGCNRSRSPNAEQHAQQMLALDQKIGDDIEQALIARFRNLLVTDEIAQRYGKFRELKDVRTTRANYPGMLTDSKPLDFAANARFEKAQVRVTLRITAGKSASIDRLDMVPSESWRRANPSMAGEFKVVDGELWLVQPSCTGRCTINGWANHPDYVPNP